MSESIAALMRNLSHGVYVVGVAANGVANAFTAAWVMQVSFNPLMVAVSINPLNASYRLIKAGTDFTVNILGHDQIATAAHFGQPTPDKLLGIRWTPSEGGSPILDNVAAYLTCRMVGEIPAGDHRVVLGQVNDGAILREGVEPLTYRATGEMDGSTRCFPKRL